MRERAREDTVDHGERGYQPLTLSALNIKTGSMCITRNANYTDRGSAIGERAPEGTVNHGERGYQPLPLSALNIKTGSMCITTDSNSPLRVPAIGHM